MSTPDKPDQGRRALVLAVAAGTCAMAAVAGGPTLAVVVSPLGAHGGAAGAARWVRATKLDQLKEGEPRRVAMISDRHDAWTVERDVELGSVWLIRHGDKVTAFSAVCPHLGCSVNSAPAGFACPCHTSAFDASGKRTGGPSPRDLDTLETKIEDGQVMVDFRRFRIGVEEKAET